MGMIGNQPPSQSVEEFRYIKAPTHHPENVAILFSLLKQIIKKGKIMLFLLIGNNLSVNDLSDKMSRLQFNR